MKRPDGLVHAAMNRFEQMQELVKHSLQIAHRVAYDETATQGLAPGITARSTRCDSMRFILSMNDDAQSVACASRFSSLLSAAPLSQTVASVRRVHQPARRSQDPRASQAGQQAARRARDQLGQALPGRAVRASFAPDWPPKIA